MYTVFTLLITLPIHIKLFSISVTAALVFNFKENEGTNIKPVLDRVVYWRENGKAVYAYLIYIYIYTYVGGHTNVL